MSEQLEIQVSDKIKSYLDEIADRLWTGHSAVMIGAGFSKNSSNTFPAWNHLGNIFHEKVHGRLPREDQHYLNVLKLANEVEAAFGRPALDQLLRIQIPDDNFEPSELHSQLLHLPWVDVFTTNYDTLLEKAAKNIIAQKFDIVVNKEDLVYSEKPRIVKLHGSFPSERPFIITEEDYRRYPKEFAPFVNTVQQSLIENTLCLIGFSGDDPNFLQWIGWIRDNLEKGFSPKIYLVGIFKLSEAQKKLIEERNIILIDMSLCAGVEDDHRKALEIFFEYLGSKKETFNQLNWAAKQTALSLNSDISLQIKAIIPEWKKQRKDYPGWIVLPEDQRTSLWWNMQGWMDCRILKSDLSDFLDIEFLYEFNWRLEKCLCPIFGEFIKYYESIVEKYNPYPGLIQAATDVEIINAKSLDEIGIKWIDLQLSMMRYYREEGLIKQWKYLNERMKILYLKLSDEQKSWICYERCLFALFALDIEELKKQLYSWDVDETLPFWNAKRAGLMAEQGDIYDAEKILEKSLTAVRRRLNLSPISTDYTFVSQESYIMMLYKLVKNAISFSQGKFGNNKELSEEFSERWNSLKQYKCDPWNELKLFDIFLEKQPHQKKEVSEKREFDIGKVTRSIHFSHNSTEEINSYNFLRWIEDVGLSFKIQNVTLGGKAASGALTRIALSSPAWALAVLFRMGDTKLVESIFSREALYKKDINQIDDLVSEYLNVIINVKSEIANGDWFNNQTFGIHLAGIIPEILSRLSVKCSGESREKIFSFLMDVYKSEHILKYHNIAHLFKRLMESLSENDQYSKIPDLLKFPILGNTHPLIGNDFPDPFRFLHVSKDTMSNVVKLSIDSLETEKLLSGMAANDSEKRKRVIWRLTRLRDANLLTEEQTIKFANALWGQVEESSGFPAHVDFLKCSFLSLPHPPEIHPEELLKKYINKLSFPVQGKQKGVGVSITGGTSRIFDELFHGTKTFTSNSGLEWSEKESIEILSSLLVWWDSDKEYLQKERNSLGFDDAFNEFKNRFRTLVCILVRVVIPRLTIQIKDSMKGELSRLLFELEKYGVPSLSSQAISIIMFPQTCESIYKRINLNVLSDQKEVVSDAYEAIYQLFILNKFKNGESVPLSIISCLSTPIKWKDDFRIIDSMKTSINIVQDAPDLLPKEIIGDILIGLDGVASENLPSIQGSLLNFSEKLEQRRDAAMLAYRLFEYIKNKGESVPDVLFRWQEICADVNEFAEVRNQWQE